MEYNRDEALKAVAVSESMFAKRDIIGAKKFALKAQTLNPSLDGIAQMIATLNVLLSAEAMINGERDWYAILSLSASADDETVKKQYRKLVLMLHPDKNKSFGAESAFKLVSEAWSILSDKTKRTAYNQRRNFGMYRHESLQPYSFSNGFCHFANTSFSVLRTKKHVSGIRVDPSAKSAARFKAPCTVDLSANGAVRNEVPNTFWTSCLKCKMQYEYLRIYVNHELLCPSCQELFLATEIANPKDSCVQSTSNSSRSTHKYGKNDYCASGRGFQYFTNLDSDKTSSFHWGAFSRTAGAASAAASFSAAAQAANMVHKAYEKVRREREEKQAAARQEKIARNKSHAFKNAANALHSRCLNGCIDVGTFEPSHTSLGCSFGADHPSKKRRMNSDSAMNSRRRRL